MTDMPHNISNNHHMNIHNNINTHNAALPSDLLFPSPMQSPSATPTTPADLTTSLHAFYALFPPTYGLTMKSPYVEDIRCLYCLANSWDEELFPLSELPQGKDNSDELGAANLLIKYLQIALNHYLVFKDSSFGLYDSDSHHNLEDNNDLTNSRKNSASINSEISTTDYAIDFHRLNLDTLSLLDGSKYILLLQLILYFGLHCDRKETIISIIMSSLNEAIQESIMQSVEQVESLLESDETSTTGSEILQKRQRSFPMSDTHTTRARLPSSQSPLSLSGSRTTPITTQIPRHHNRHISIYSLEERNNIIEKTEEINYLKSRIQSLEQQLLTTKSSMQEHIDAEVERKLDLRVKEFLHTQKLETFEFQKQKNTNATQLSALQHEMEAMQQELLQSDREKAQYKLKYEQLIQENARLKDEKQILKEKVEFITAMENQLAKMRSRMQEHNDMVEKLTEVSELSQERATIISNLQREIREYQLKIEQLQKWKDRVAEKEREATESKLQLTRHQMELLEVKKDKDKFHEYINALKNEMDRMKDAHSKEKEELLQLLTEAPASSIDRDSPKLRNEIMESVQLYSPKQHARQGESENGLLLKDTTSNLPPAHNNNTLELEKNYQEKIASLQHEVDHLTEELEHYKQLSTQMEESYLETQKQIITWEFQCEKAEKSHREECEQLSHSKDELLKQEIEYKKTIQTQKVELENLTKQFELLRVKYQADNESRGLPSKINPTATQFELSLVSSAFYNMGLQHFTDHIKLKQYENQSNKR